MTYATWQAQGIAFAAWLQAQGVRKGDRVALMIPLLAVSDLPVLGTVLAGAVVVNVNPLYTSTNSSTCSRTAAPRPWCFENFAHTLEKVVAGSTVKRVVIAAIGDLLGTFKGAAMNFILRRVQKQVPAYNLPGALRFNQTLKQGRGLTGAVHATCWSVGAASRMR
ncbi:AMP-binding protein, partial [Carnobacterium maltaromaticum]|uniref:AMP-binding protein n=1 Tax=Carnobacterium maltaromaticum TaxID=2751 RepID=UPI0039BE1213